MSDATEATRPPLSVVIPARDGMAELDPVLEALLPEAGASGTEVLIVGDVDGPRDGGVLRLIPVSEPDILVLRRHGLALARGEVVAMGEDHAVPRPGWCEAVIRAHSERPDADAVVGCLANGTDETVAGRANFLAFASPWQPPMATLPGGRPPPSSVLSLKRSVLRGIEGEAPGWFEADLLPALFEEGRMVADDRIVVDHFQDHGSIWSIRNSFHSARSSYGYARAGLDPASRREVARWALTHIPRHRRSEAGEGLRGARMGASESVLLSMIALASGLGAAAGLLTGPGLAPTESPNLGGSAALRHGPGGRLEAVGGSVLATRQGETRDREDRDRGGEQV